MTAGRGGSAPETRLAAAASVVVDVDVRVGPHTGSGRCVTTGDRTVVDLPGLAAPRTISTAALPEWLAGLVGVGPRPAVSSPGVLILRRDVLDAVLDLAAPDVAALAAALAPEPVPRRWLELLAALGAGLCGRWRVGICAPGGGDALEILDCASAGLWAVHPCPVELGEAELGDGGDLVSLAPTTSATVWAWLSRLAATG